MHPCFENLERIIQDHSSLTSKRLPQYDDMALRITDSLLDSADEGIITAQLLPPNEIMLAVRLTNPINKDEHKKEIYEFLFSLAAGSIVAIFPDKNNQFSASVRFRCWVNLSDLERELEANLEILRHFIDRYGGDIHGFLGKYGF